MIATYPAGSMYVSDATVSEGILVYGRVSFGGNGTGESGWGIGNALCVGVPVVGVFAGHGAETGNA